MNFIHPKTIEDLIITALKNGEKRTTEILEIIKSIRKGTTKQAFYAALRKLKQEESVVVYKGSVALHTSWIRKMQESIEQIAQTYSIGLDAFNVLGLANKESLSFIFSNSRSLDIFWGHAQNILMYHSPSSEPIYSFDPCYWFFIAREDSEKKLLEEIVRNKRQFLMTVNEISPFDSIIRQYFNNDYLQYNIKQFYDKDNYYFTVIGDYITEVWLDPSIARKIKQLYKDYKQVNESLVSSLERLLEIKSRNKIKITRDAVKADKLKKKLSRDFFVIR